MVAMKWSCGLNNAFNKIKMSNLLISTFLFIHLFYHPPPSPQCILNHKLNSVLVRCVFIVCPFIFTLSALWLSKCSTYYGLTHYLMLSICVHHLNFVYIIHVRPKSHKCLFRYNKENNNKEQWSTMVTVIMMWWNVVYFIYFLATYMLS